MVRGARITPGTEPPLATVALLSAATALTHRVLAAAMLWEAIITTRRTVREFTADIDPAVAMARR
jgi:hypothetical protein